MHTVTFFPALWAAPPWTQAAEGAEEDGEDEVDEEAAAAAAAAGTISNPITISSRVVMAAMGEIPRGDTNRITSEG